MQLRRVERVDIQVIVPARDKYVRRSIVRRGRKNRAIVARNSNQQIALALVEVFADEATPHSLPDVGEVRIQIFGNQRRDLILQTLQLGVGKRQVIGIGADSKLPNLSHPHTWGRQESNDRAGSKEGQRHKACLPYSCSAAGLSSRL